MCSSTGYRIWINLLACKLLSESAPYWLYGVLLSVRGRDSEDSAFLEYKTLATHTFMCVYVAYFRMRMYNPCLDTSVVSCAISLHEKTVF